MGPKKEFGMPTHPTPRGAQCNRIPHRSGSSPRRAFRHGIAAYRIAAILAAVFVGGGIGTTKVEAQASSADLAAAMLEAALELENLGDEAVAEALYRHIADRFSDTPAAETARARLGEAERTHEGLGGATELKVWSSLFGLWLGVQVPFALATESSAAFGLGLLVGGPVGYMTGNAYARSRPLSRGQARAITWGGTWGALQGFGWANALDVGQDSEGSNNALSAFMIGGGLAGVAVGAWISERQISDGVATSASTGSLWGAWIGGAGSHVLGQTGNAVWYSAVLTGNAGLVAGAWAGRQWGMSRRRARLISILGVVGGFGGLGVALITDSSSDRVVMAQPLAGSILGLAIGAGVTQSRREEEGREDADRDLFAPGALLNLSKGRWSVAAPLPLPAPVRASDPRRGTPETVWRVPLLHMRF